MRRWPAFSCFLAGLLTTIACGGDLSSMNGAGAKSTTDAAAENSNDSPETTTKLPLEIASEVKLPLSTWAQEVYPTGIYNKEQEGYTNGGKNVTFDANGGATITAVQQSNTTWTSARLSGPNLAELTDSLPIYIEATMKTPSAVGTWPAFWLLGRGSWPMAGEIDIMEQINGNGNSYVSTHRAAKPNNPTFNTSTIAAHLDLSVFHRYGALLSADGVQFYLDGKATGSVVAFPAAADFVSLVPNLYPIVNLAIGGQWPGAAPSTTGNQILVVQQVIARKTPPTQ